MPKFLFGLFFVSVVISGCRNNTLESKNYFDSLVTTTSNYLVKNKARLNKHTAIGQKQDTATFQPDSLGWNNELDVFRQLNAFQLPAYRDKYQVTDGIKDSQSNLLFREFKASAGIPIPLARFYYYQKIKNLKRIEAEFHETNTLYISKRHLIMEFEERNNKPVLTRYSINGVQQMILSDSVTYAINGGISFN
jgi:hypothetical protein